MHDIILIVYDSCILCYFIVCCSQPKREHAVRSRVYYTQHTNMTSIYRIQSHAAKLSRSFFTTILYMIAFCALSWTSHAPVAHRQLHAVIPVIPVKRACTERLAC